MDAPELAARLAAVPAAQPVLGLVGAEPRAWLVGGVVRDALLGVPPGPDLDLVVEGDALALAAALADRLGGEVAAMHERFGTATVRAGGHAYDVAAARRERYPRPGALPEVEPAPLADDLLRRDFTVNALAARPDGELRAAPRGLEDLAAGRLRVLHERAFHDDPTRLLRLVRYAGRLDFAIEAGTVGLARLAVEDGAPATVSGARIGAELRLLLGEDRAGAALGLADDLGLLEALHPGLRWDPALAGRALALRGDARPGLLVLAVLAHEVEPAALEAWLGHLELRADERRRVVEAVRRAPAAAAALREPPSAVAELLRPLAPETVALAGALGPADLVRRWQDRWRHVRLEVTGEDLRAAGLEGPAIGAGLRRALARKLDGKLEGRDAELRAALEG